MGDNEINLEGNETNLGNNEIKQKELFGSIMGSPDATLDDFIIAGYTADNTYLLDEDTYKNNAKVREYFSDKDGNFKEDEFERTYKLALVYYNNLSYKSYDDAIKERMVYDREDIFAPIDLRKKGPAFVEYESANPDRQVYNLVQIGRYEDPIFSRDEIAQSNKVLANPTTAGDNLENAEWIDAPNGHFWNYLLDTLVLAQYDEDGTHTDPFTGEEVQHVKGELKLNQDGEYYYEKLDGRNIYGRQVLNKLNILTVDGTKLNQYDFFDSDDIGQKSFWGSVFKTAALVGSMFIPYIGPVITWASIGTEALGIGAVLGKMLLGSNNSTLSAIEGWSASWDRKRAKTQYAQEHMWCWENFITTVGDFVEIGKKQRALFTGVPRLVTGVKNIPTAIATEGSLAKKASAFAGGFKDLTTIEGQNAEMARLTEEILTKNTEKISDILKSDKALSLTAKDVAKVLQLTDKNVAHAMASQVLSKSVKQALHLGEVVSRTYMSFGIASDMYGEAKAAGASDIDATLLTLGYTAAVHGFLKLGVSKWIFPELRAEGYRAKAIVKALMEKNKDYTELNKKVGEIVGTSFKKGKKEYCMNLFRAGKNIANSEYCNGTKTLTSTLAGSAAMGIEGLGFEFLSDFSKGCYDVVNWLRGNENRMESFSYNFEEDVWDWKQMLQSYGNNFLSAFLAGGITSLSTNFKQMRSLSLIDNKKAISELTFLVRNGLAKKFLDEVEKMDIGDKHLSFDFETIGDQIIFKPADKTGNNSQDRILKDAIKNQVQIIESILNENGGNLSDSSILDMLSLKDLRLSFLQQSSTAGLYLRDAQELLRLIVDNGLKINDLSKRLIDINRDGLISDKEAKEAGSTNPEHDKIVKELKEAKEKLALLKKDFEKFKSGEMAREFAAVSLYEMNGLLNDLNPYINFVSYVEKKTGKKWEDVSNTEKINHFNDFRNLKSTTGIERIKELALNLLDVNESVANLIKEHGDSYTNASTEEMKAKSVINDIYNVFKDILELDSSSEVINLSNRLNNKLATLLDTLISIVSKFGTESEIEKCKDYIKQISQLEGQINANPDNVQQLKKKHSDLIRTLQNELLSISSKHANEIINAFVKLGYMPTSLKRFMYTLSDYIKETNDVNIDVDKLKDLPESFVLKALDEFELAIVKEQSSEEKEKGEVTTTTFRISNLLDELRKNYKNQVHLDNFKLLSSQLEKIKEAVEFINLYRKAIYSARTDNLNVRDIAGYNALINEVAKKSGFDAKQLAEINSTTADLIIDELNNIESELNLHIKLFNAVHGNKLGALKRLLLRKDLAFYNNTCSLISKMQNDEKLKNWKGLDLVIAALNAANMHLKFNPENVLNDFELKTFIQEKITIRDAIHEMLNNSENDLGDLINVDHFNLMTSYSELDDNMENNIDDNTFLWNLCACAALKSSDFYNNFRKIIEPSDEIIPLPGQEEALYVTYASIINKNKFQLFASLIKESLIEDYKNNIDAYKNLSKDRGVLSLIEYDQSHGTTYFVSNWTPIYDHITLIEACAGAGKTNGILKMLAKMLKVNHSDSDILKNVLIVHGGSSELASELTKNLNISENTISMGIDDFRKTYMPNYNRNNPNRKSFIEQTKENLNSNISLPELSNENNPTLIIVDEILRIDFFELQALQKLANKLNILIIAAGDGLQSKINDVFKIDDTTGISLSLSINISSFIRTLSLNTSMRTNNVVKTDNLMSLKLMLKNPNKNSIIKIGYSVENNKLYGDMYVSTNDNDKMYNALKLLIESSGDKKITYIYENDNSAAMKFAKAKFPNAFEFKTMNEVAGQEYEYCVYDFDQESLIDNGGSYNSKILSGIYTGISRSSKGSVFIGVCNNFENVEYDEVINETISKSETNKYISNYKKVLSELEIEPIDVSIISTNPILDHPGFVAKDTDDSSSVEYKNDNASLETFEIQFSESLDSEIAQLNEDEPLIISMDTPSGKIEAPLYSFNTFEYGIHVKDGKFVIDNERDVDSFSNRIDSANGLLRLIGYNAGNASNAPVKFVANYIKQLRSILLFTKDKTQLVNSIKDFVIDKFGKYEDFEFHVDFAFKQSAHNGNENREYVEKDINCMSLGKNEYTTGNNGDSEEASRPHEKKIVAIVRVSKDGKNYNILEIPLLALTSPITLIERVENGEYIYKELHDVFHNVYEKQKSIYAACKEVINQFENNPKYTNIINLFKVFVNDRNQLTYILSNEHSTSAYSLPETYKEQGLNDSTWTIAKNLKCSGPLLSRTKGSYMINDNMFLVTAASADEGSKLRTISEFKEQSGMNVSENIYVYNESMYNIKKGNPFILVSNDPNFRNDQEMLDYYKLQYHNSDLDKKVKLVYVIPPKATIGEYMNNLIILLRTRKEDRKNNQPIGNAFTSYKIVKKLLGLDSTTNLSKEDFETVKSFLGPCYEYIYNKVKELSEYENIKDPSLREQHFNVLKTILLDKEEGINFVKTIYDEVFSSNENINTEYIPYTKVNLATLFDLLLIDFVYKNVSYVDGFDGTGKSKYEEDVKRFSILEKAVKTIYYNSTSTKVEGLEYLTVDVKNYEINEKSYSINAKIDYDSFYGNIGEIAKLVVESEEIHNVKGRDLKDSRDRRYYMNSVHDYLRSLKKEQITTPESTHESTPEPTHESTPEPTHESTPEPTRESTPEPTHESTPEPTHESTPEPTHESTPEPTHESTHRVFSIFNNVDVTIPEDVINNKLNLRDAKSIKISAITRKGDVDINTLDEKELKKLKRVDNFTIKIDGKEYTMEVNRKDGIGKIKDENCIEVVSFAIN